MEESHSLLLNEEALRSCPEAKKPLFVYEWLRYLDRILPVTQKADLKSIQPQLISQLEARLTAGSGPPTRALLAKCIARVFAIGDAYSMFGTINMCNDTLKNKDDSPSQLPVKLGALACLGSLYETVGRLVGSSYEESFTFILKWLKSAESQGRAEIMCTLAKMVRGLGNGGLKIYKDMYKIVRTHAADRVMSVRVAAVQCLCSLVPEYVPLYTTDLEGMITLCVKALDGSNYECRTAVSKLLSVLLSSAHQPPAGAVMPGKSSTVVPIRPLPVDDCLQLLASAFLRGGIGGFLKGGSTSTATVGGQRDVRVGVAMGYVEWVREMGALWLEKNLGVYCRHTIELAAKCGPLAYTNNSSQSSESIQLRRCVSFILRSTIGTVLSEHAQITACKYLGQLLSDHTKYLDDPTAPAEDRLLGAEVHASAVAAQVALLELSALVRQIGTAVTPLFVEASGIMESVFGCLLHPLPSARVATAWCLRCVTLAVPSQLTPLIDRCISRLEHMKACADALSGYSLALASLLSASADCNLGIPNAKHAQVFHVAENMLKTATQQSGLAVAKINGGWILLQALSSLGPAVMRDQMHRIIPLWKAAFPRSVKEAEGEKTRGDRFSWQCALESRGGALSVMCTIAQHKELLEDETIKAIVGPIECSLVMMAQVGTLIRSYGSSMRSLISVVRIRVYALLGLLNPKCYDHLFAPLLRELVADLTLSDNAQSVQSTSLAGSLCTGAESTLLSPWEDATDQRMLENTMQSTHIGAYGSPENDTSCLVSGNSRDLWHCWPEPLPCVVQCVDSAVVTYGRVFPMVPNKHKLQITEHFSEVVKNCKQPARQSAIQLNVLCAVACALRSMNDQRNVRIENEGLQKATRGLVMPSENEKSGTFVYAISSPNPVIRCVAAEVMGRLAQAVGNPETVAFTAQQCFSQLNQKSRDAHSRTGYSLALGCIHKHVGSLGSAQHLSTGVGIMLALLELENPSPIVQAWSLVSLSLIAETGGGMFRGFVEPVLSVCLKLLLNTCNANVEVVQCIGKLLSALITCVGPELGISGLIDSLRSSLLSACALQLSHSDPLVKAEAIQGLQQMHLFAPRHVNMRHLVVDIAGLLTCPHLCLRRASVCCLRQLVQREAREVREHAQVLVPQGVVDEGKKLPLPDTGLEGALFAMLDVETDSTLRSHVQETLVSLVQATSGELLNQWLSLCKDLLATSSAEATRSTLIVEEKGEKEGDEDEEGGDDDTTLAGPRAIVTDKGKVTPRWPTRVFATQIVQRLMSVCDTERAHLDLALAKELQMSSSGRADYLVLHLSDLVRMSFMGATSDNTELRLAGLNSLQDVITRFSSVPEPEFPGHVILEQFQAQVGAALRPAFTEDTPSHVTAAACQVCSTWIGSGVARDLNDLRRVHQLLVSSLSKLRHGSINTQLYSESAATLEKLSILKAWAEVYVTAVEQEEIAKERKEEDVYMSAHSESLLSLVKPELESLVGYWLAALRDAALLSLPVQFSDQLPTEGGAFYKNDSSEVCREYYRTSWPPILLAASIWLKNGDFKLPPPGDAPSVWPDNKRESRFYLMIGLSIDALASRTGYTDDQTTQQCVRSLCTLLSCEWCQLHLMSDVKMAIEVVNVLHRLILTRDCPSTQQWCVDCAQSVLDAAVCSMRLSQQGDIENGNLPSPCSDFPTVFFAGNEGSKDGLSQGNSLSFAMLELCLCVMVRQMPQINSAQMKSRSLAPLHLRKFGRLPTESARLIRSGIHLLVQVPSLCSSSARLTVLPVCLYLVIGFLRESARIDESSVVPDLPPGHLTATATAALQALRNLASSPPSDETLQQWMTIMRSALFSLLTILDGSSRVDGCVILLACAVLSSVAPRDVVLGHSESFHRLCRLIKEQLNSPHPQVVVKTLQSVTSLFSRRDACSPFVKHLGPSVFDVIQPLVIGEKALQNCLDISEDRLLVAQEAIKTMEVLVTVAVPKKKLSLINLVVQALCRLLCAISSDEWRSLSPSARKLHETAIQRLNAIAPMHPVEFKTVLSAHPQLKKRLEAALLFQSSRVNQAQQNAAKKMAEQAKTSSTTQPTIKLTMDFNAFGKATAAE